MHQVTVTRPAFTWTSHEVQHGGLYNGSIYESPGALCGHVGRVLAKPCMYNLQNNVAWITVIKLAFVPKDPSVHRLIGYGLRVGRACDNAKTLTQILCFNPQLFSDRAVKTPAKQG